MPYFSDAVARPLNMSMNVSKFQDNYKKSLPTVENEIKLTLVQSSLSGKAD